MYTADRGNGNQIYVMDAQRGDAAPVQPISRLAGQSGQGRFSPDGRFIAYHNGPGSEAGDLYVVDAAASNQEGRRLTTGSHGDAEPAWSPDGTTIAFSSRRTGSREVFLIPAAGGEIEQVTDLRADASRPQWSPKGDAIAFQSAHDDVAFDLTPSPRPPARRSAQPA